MEGQRQPGHQDYPQGSYAGTDSAVLDPRGVDATLRSSDNERREPIPEDPITGLRYGLMFGIAIWAFLLSLGVAIFR